MYIRLLGFYLNRGVVCTLDVGVQASARAQAQRIMKERKECVRGEVKGVCVRRGKGSV
jgi:hypothetical protein